MVNQDYDDSQRISTTEHAMYDTHYLLTSFLLLSRLIQSKKNLQMPFVKYIVLPFSYRLRIGAAGLPVIEKLYRRNCSIERLSGTLVLLPFVKCL
jgi:hypothetical protein